MDPATALLRWVRAVAEGALFDVFACSSATVWAESSPLGSGECSRVETVPSQCAKIGFVVLRCGAAVESPLNLERLRAAREAAYRGALARVRSRSDAGETDRDRPDNEVVTPELAEAEVIFLRCAIGEIWGGPAHMTHEVAALLGYKGKAAFYQDQERLVHCVDGALPASRGDWRRLLLAAELAFASYDLGGAWDWQTVTGINDEASILVLRALQSKLWLL